MSNKQWAKIKRDAREPVFAILRPANTIIQPIVSQNVNTDQTRKAIPKKIRGEAWIKQFGDSTKGCCYCCKVGFGIFDNWHAGHIIAHSNGGKDTADNLRPICGSCNQSMGTEHMDTFKARCYPN